MPDLAFRTFDPTTGWLKNQECGFGSDACSQNETYTYDPVGNLILRQNNNLGLNEGFFYDNVYRLDHSTLNGVINLQMGYDLMGNITSRSDIANGATWTPNSAHIHQVMQAGDAAHTYSYDNNGNATTCNGSSIARSSDNYPTQINSANETVNLAYDANRQRYEQTYISNGQTETTIYIGGLTQKVTANGTTDYRYQITAGNQLIAVMDSPSNGSNALHYILEDHQGGISKITNSDGSSDVSESFTAFGARRNPLTWSGLPTYGDLQKINAIAREGYTGQTALGNMGLNHMNGRVEDAITGRFLSADPYITEPDNTQNYNRYSYVYNNPMSYTDPTGFDTASSDDNTLDTVDVTGKRGCDSLCQDIMNQQNNIAIAKSLIPGRSDEVPSPTCPMVGSTCAPTTPQPTCPMKGSTCGTQKPEPPCPSGKMANLANLLNKMGQSSINTGAILGTTAMAIAEGGLIPEPASPEIEAAAAFTATGAGITAGGGYALKGIGSGLLWLQGNAQPLLKTALQAGQAAIAKALHVDLPPGADPMDSVVDKAAGENKCN